MAKAKKQKATAENINISDYRFDDSKRKNIPPAGLAAQGVMEDAPKQRFYYDPHLPPVLRFDNTGDADKLPELLSKAKKQALSESEIQLLADALRKQEPWLEWTGKREKKWFEVDPVALNIHERVSTQAILKIAKRENVQRDLFADPEMEYREAVKFYKHDMDWANRLILGDSLQVMASLAYRENLAGKVQMIFFDPPYGIKFSKNLQAEVRNSKPKESDDDLSREIESVKAYRDTWQLGIHSYLNYLRDRIISAKKLLNETGSIFIQISDENVHLIRNLMDEIFGRHNFIAEINFRKKTMPLGAKFLERMGDILIWYSKDITKLKYNPLYTEKNYTEDFHFNNFEYSNGLRVKVNDNSDIDKKDGKFFRLVSLWPASFSPNSVYAINFRGKNWLPAPNQCWPTSPEGMNRIIKTEQVEIEGNYLRKILYADKSSSYGKITCDWSDTIGAREKVYVVQTSEEVVKRCILMTTSPGDLVLDPTCGSGTTAFVAEHWARRWITIDTSRVAIALSRQRLLTAKFNHYKLKDDLKSPNGSNDFKYDFIPQVTLKSISQNVSLDTIFEKYDILLEDALTIVNKEYKSVSKNIKQNLLSKLLFKQKAVGKKNITDADNRRWKLPEISFEHWEIPFDTDEGYPPNLGKAIENYRIIALKKMDEINACIQANAENVELFDKPEKSNGVVRVSGPFTVEGVMPAEFNMDDTSAIESIDSELETFDVATNAVSFIDNMSNLLKREGVTFTGNKHKKFSDLRTYEDNSSFINFEGEWANGDKVERKVAVSIGPQHGPVTAWQVEQVIRMAYKRGFDDVVFAGFSFTAEAQATIQDDANPKIQLHLAQIRPDVQMGDLLKNTGTGQVFTVFGSPRVKLTSTIDGQLQVTMEGVDIYDPVANTIVDSKADKVAAWFLDSDYDGRTFCITQAFFPDRDAWKKLEKALKGVIDIEKFESFSGTVSLPFPIGEHKKAAVKVIDPRGNEVMKVLSLDKPY